MDADLTSATTAVVQADNSMIGLAVVILGIAVVYGFLLKRSLYLKG